MLRTDPENQFCLLKTGIAFHPCYVLWLVVHAVATQIKIDTISETKWGFFFIFSSYNFKVFQTFWIPHTGSLRPPRNFVQPGFGFF